MSSATSPGGPAWLGIGAQRSGTTWFTGLLTQHPGMQLGLNGRKEQHSLYRHDGLASEDRYRALFAGDDVLRGEWTPMYLRALSTAPLARRLCRPDAPMIVMLRDPVERFASAMRLWNKRRRRGKASPFQFVLGDAHWAGMYADQLDAWSEVVGRERLHVFVYESVVLDPQAACAAVWRRLGLDPVSVRDQDKRSYSSAHNTAWEWPEGLQMAITSLYASQVARLRDDWQLDVGPWKNFTGLTVA